MFKLVFVRHGQASDGVDDQLRQLTPLGIAQINKAGDFLRHKGLRISQAFHSGKLRAKQTAEILCQQIGYEEPLNELNLLLPNANPSELIQKLSSYFNTDIVLFVGHLPHIRDFAFELSGFKHAGMLQSIQFNPGTVLLFDTEDLITWRLSESYDPVSC